MKIILDSGLVLSLPLHELAGGSFMSPDAYGHRCTVTGALWRPHGRYFDGIDDFIACGDNPALEITGAITIEMWFYPTSLTASQCLLSKVTGAVQDLYLYYYSGGYFIFIINGTWCLRLAKAELNLNAWNHLVFTVKDGSTDNHAYVNTVDRATNQNAPTMTSGTSTLYIGSYAGVAEFTSGQIGEVRIYRRALTPQEIQQNYLATKWRYR